MLGLDGLREWFPERWNRSLIEVPARFPVPASGVPLAGGGSVVADFRSRLVAYEDQHATIPRTDIAFAAGSAIGLLAFAGFVALALPSPDSLASGAFVLVAKGLVAGLATVLKDLAVPLGIVGVACLAIDAFMFLRPRLPILWHYVCAAQPLIIVGAGLGATGLALVLLVSLIIWILLVALVIVVIGLFLGG